MARLVVKSSFVAPSSSGGAAHLSNYVGYIATREGVELNDAPGDTPAPNRPYQEISHRTDLPPTEKQEQLIRQLIRDFPDSRESLEYEDYIARPSMASASEFISRAEEDHFFEITDREGYIQYLATRPGAERDGSHGLWSASDEPPDLDEVAYRVSHHDGNVWTHIISLRREDAAKTGMENAASWRELIKSQAGTIAQAMGIPPADLRWYAAFHNESHHPHIHMVAYSAGRAPFLGKEGLQEIKSGLAGEIFREELMETYQAQTEYRDDLTSQWREMLTSGDGLPQVETQLRELARFLSAYKGKAVYGYLPRPQRELVNHIVDELGQTPRIRNLYADWYAQRDKITGIYRGEAEKRLPLSQNTTFKPLKNAVIQTAVDLAVGLDWAIPDGTGLDDAAASTWGVPELPELPDEPEPAVSPLTTPEEWMEKYPYPGERDVPEPAVPPQTAPEEWSENAPATGKQDAPEPSPPESPVEEKKKGWWTGAYRNARLLLYGSPGQEPMPKEAFVAMREEAATGNPLAQHDLGHMLLQGIGTQVDPAAAEEQFRKALAGFTREANRDRPAYWQYRIGKMYAMGYGVDQDYTQSAGWYQKSVDLGNPFAAYALAGQYSRGHGVDLSYEQAFHLYEMAANDEKSPSPYAKWELAKMCGQGLGTTIDADAAAAWYTGAYEGFQALERHQLDDKLVYRLGYMEYRGLGTEQDIPAAIKHFERAAKLGNPSASYHLAKIYLAGEEAQKDVPKAVELLEKLKEDAFYAPQAAYHLAKLYLEDAEIPDIKKGISNLEFAVERDNPYAAYKLARILAAGEPVAKDVPKAVELLEKLKENETLAPLAACLLGKLQTSDPAVLDIAQGMKNLEFAAARGNHFAAYSLGRIYYFGHGDFQDRELGLKYLRDAASQGNEFAAQTLEHIEKLEHHQQAAAALGLLRLFERSMRAKLRQQPKRAPDPHQRRKELEKKQAQGMKMG